MCMYDLSKKKSLVTRQYFLKLRCCGGAFAVLGCLHLCMPFVVPPGEGSGFRAQAFVLHAFLTDRVTELEI